MGLKRAVEEGVVSSMQRMCLTKEDKLLAAQGYVSHYASDLLQEGGEGAPCLVAFQQEDPDLSKGKNFVERVKQNYNNADYLVDPCRYGLPRAVCTLSVVIKL